jgi:hypothetical protein
MTRCCALRLRRTEAGCSSTPVRHTKTRSPRTGVHRRAVPPSVVTTTDLTAP